MKRMFELNNTLPPHGFIGCRSCYPTADDSHKFRNSDGTKWKIEQPNATWGSQTPEVVVLGFSRGVNPMAYDSHCVRFVHVIHAKAQGRLIPDGLKADGSQVQKNCCQFYCAGAEYAANVTCAGQCQVV